MSIKVNITDEQKKVKLPTGTRLLIRKACIATLKLEGFPDSAEINVTLVNDDMIKEMTKSSGILTPQPMFFPSRSVKTASMTQIPKPRKNAR